MSTGGGWSDFTPDLSAEDKAVFDEATGQLLGVDYTALAVSKQIVAGVNYRFEANAQVVTPDAPVRKVLIEIFQPLGQEQPYITQITNINA